VAALSTQGVQAQEEIRRKESEELTIHFGRGIFLRCAKNTLKIGI